MTSILADDSAGTRRGTDAHGVSKLRAYAKSREMASVVRVSRKPFGCALTMA